MISICFGAAARTEMLEAVDWYNAHAPGIGEQFLAEVDAVVARISERPLLFPVVFKGVRRARLHHFPFSLFFRVEDAGIYVLACFHSNRAPRHWQGRR